MQDANNPLVASSHLDQSIWLDYIQRSMLQSGELQRLIQDDNIRGITSNPAIFEAAIANSDEYDDQLAAIIQDQSDVSAQQIFHQLAISDIATAADIFLPTHQGSRGDDGMVSLEVSPSLAHDAAATVQEALQLHAALGRPNVMIKVPGTKAGVTAFQELTARGISVNVTLLFSLQRYKEILEAYLSGLESRVNETGTAAGIASVASFFVSRVDGIVDPLLAAHQDTDSATGLRGEIAIANAKAAYLHYQNEIATDRFSKLRSAGALPQRLLWASTGTKNPEYSDVYYVEALLGPETVNTLPPKTMDAFRDHGNAQNNLLNGLDSASGKLAMLTSLGIDLEQITDDLEAAGIAGFSIAFDRLLAAIDSKRQALRQG